MPPPPKLASRTVLLGGAEMRLRMKAGAARPAAAVLKNERRLTVRDWLILFEQVRFFTGDLVPHGLELERAAVRVPHLRARGQRILPVDRDRLAGGLSHELGLAATLHGDEPPGGFIHGLAYGQQSVIAQNHRLRVAQRLGDAVSLGGLVDYAGIVVEQAVIFVKRAGILRDRIEQPAERRPRFAVHGMGVSGGHGVGPRGVYAGMDGEGGGVDRAVALDRFAQVVDQNQIGDTDVSEINAERIDPKAIGLLGVAGGDVAGHSLIESVTGKQTEGRGEAFLAVAALLGKGGEGARRRQVLDSSWSFGHIDRKST